MQSRVPQSVRTHVLFTSAREIRNKAQWQYHLHICVRNLLSLCQQYALRKPQLRLVLFLQVISIVRLYRPTYVWKKHTCGLKSFVLPSAMTQYIFLFFYIPRLLVALHTSLTVAHYKSKDLLFLLTSAPIFTLKSATFKLP